MDPVDPTTERKPLTTAERSKRYRQRRGTTATNSEIAQRRRANTLAAKFVRENFPAVWERLKEEAKR